MEFRARTIQKALKEAHHTARSAAPEGEPYRSKIAAAKILAECRKICEVYEDDGHVHDNFSLTEAVAIATCQRGLYLLETDQLVEGEAGITEGLDVLELAPDRFGALLQQVCNVVLWRSPAGSGCVTLMG